MGARTDFTWPIKSICRPGSASPSIRRIRRLGFVSMNLPLPHGTRLIFVMDHHLLGCEFYVEYLWNAWNDVLAKWPTVGDFLEVLSYGCHPFETVPLYLLRRIFLFACAYVCVAFRLQGHWNNNSPTRWTTRVYVQWGNHQVTSLSPTGIRNSVKFRCMSTQHNWLGQY